MTGLTFEEALNKAHKWFSINSVFAKIIENYDFFISKRRKVIAFFLAKYFNKSNKILINFDSYKFRWFLYLSLRFKQWKKSYLVFLYQQIWEFIQD